MRSKLHIVLLVMLAAACTKDPGFSGVDPQSGRPTVSVALNLAVAPNEAGTPGTKVDYEPESPGYDASAAIKTVTVLQFEKDEAGDGYTRIGNQVCYDYDAVLAGTENIPLVTSARENIIFVIANATDPGLETIQLPGHGSLSDFLELQNGNLLSSLDSPDGSGIWYTPAGGTDRYLRMSAAIKVDGVTLGTTIGTSGSPLALKRNCAKVVVHVKNTSASDPVTVEAVQLRDINKQYHYVTNIPAGLPVAFSDPYSPMNPRRFNEAEQAFPAENNPGGAGAGSAVTYTFYVPANLRGTIANASQADKNRHAPQGATHFCVYATYGAPAKHVTYTYFLGADLTSDFNLEANKKYEYTVDLNGKGNPLVDGRIEDVDEVRFGVDANCYMLKPPVRDGASTTFSFPVRRAAVFWNVPGTNMGVYGAATTEYYELLESTDWEAFFVWNEVTDGAGAPVPDSALLVDSHDDGEGNYVAAGRGFNPGDAGANPFIRIKVTNGMKGNALVAIRKTSDPTMGDILWSWHLWVTDYDPYIEMTPVAGNYIYAVPNGDIHRYAGTTWNTAEYGNAFIMDRNLGARIVIGQGHEALDRIGLYYQGGRKDPFQNTGTVTVIGADNTGQPPEGAGVKHNIPYSVHFPYIFISGSYWTSYETGGNILGASGAAWNDPKIELHGIDNCESGKSIYDPCPYGWQVPASGVWSDLRSVTTEWAAAPAAVGLYYYPEGFDPLATKGRIFFPANGCRYTGPIRDFNTAGGYWSVMASSALYFSATMVSPVNSYWYADRRAAGQAVRCIRLNYTRPY